jgi:hypothetical protein
MNPMTPGHVFDKLQQSKHIEVVSDFTHRQKNLDFGESEAIFHKEVQNRVGALTISEATEAWTKKDIGLAQYHLLSALVQQAIAGADFLPILSTGNIPKATLDALSKSHDEKILEAVAQNPNTSPSALGFIGCNSKEWLALDSIARNPNTPGPVLLELAKYSLHFKGEVAGNPGLSAPEHELFANDADVRCSYASNPILSPDQLEELAKSQDPWICFGVAENPNSNISTLKKLAKDKSSWKYLVRNPTTDSETLSLIASDLPADLLGNIAGHENTDPVVLEKIIRASLLHVSVLSKNVAMRNKNMSQATLEVLFNWGNYDEVASNQSTSTNMLDRIAKLKRKSTYFELARNSNASPELIRFLSTSKDELVRGAVASNTSCPISLLEFLSQDQSAYVRWRVLANPNTSESVRESLSNSVLAMADLSSNYWFVNQMKLASQEVKEAVTNGNIYHYHGKDPNGRALSKLEIAKLMALCSGPHVKPERVARLSVSTDWLIRAAVARNAATPLNLLNKLVNDVQPVVAALAKQNIEKNLSPRNYSPFLIENLTKKIEVNNDVVGSPIDVITVGCKVMHAKFGQGEVLAREGSGLDARAHVIFSNRQVKWLALSVANLTVINS